MTIGEMSRWRVCFDQNGLTDRNSWMTESLSAWMHFRCIRLTQIQRRDDHLDMVVKCHELCWEMNWLTSQVVIIMFFLLTMSRWATIQSDGIHLRRYILYVNIARIMKFENTCGNSASLYGYKKDSNYALWQLHEPRAQHVEIRPTSWRNGYYNETPGLTFRRWQNVQRITRTHQIIRPIARGFKKLVTK